MYEHAVTVFYRYGYVLYVPVHTSTGICTYKKWTSQILYRKYKVQIVQIVLVLLSPAEGGSMCPVVLSYEYCTCTVRRPPDLYGPYRTCTVRTGTQY